ncbi:hypothetical protein Scep_022659 [Stephania cephalantha]|uniref:Uncharacterized protein n=1 Tax=Stephania cephalantha TaxID=152367 RepID=A0AAP0F8D6_9MAGN
MARGMCGIFSGVAVGLLLKRFTWVRSRPMYGELVVKACVAAGDGDRYKATCLKISVDGRRRMSPPVPDDFVGNVVLWAYPRAGINV